MRFTAKRFAGQSMGATMRHLLFSNFKMRGLSMPLPEISRTVKATESETDCADASGLRSNDHSAKKSAALAEYQENCESESHKNNLCILSATRHKDGGAQE